MTSKIFKSILSVAIAVLLASLVVITGMLYQYFGTMQESQLKDELSLAASATEQLGQSYLSQLDSERYRLTWVDADGMVIFDTHADSATMDNHENREEIREALLTFNSEAAGEFNPYEMSKFMKFKQGNSVASGVSNYVVEGAQLTVTLNTKVTAPGEYKLVIPEGLITRKSDGRAYSGELAVTITAPEAIVVKSVSPSEDVYSLKTIELTLNKEVVAVENATATIELKDAEGAVVATAACAVEGNVLTLTLDNEITTPGEYTIVIPEGVVVGAAIGDAFSAEVAITVEEFDVYEPRNIGNKTRSDRAINSVSITSEMYGISSYELNATDKGLDYVNVASVAEPVSFMAEVGETLTPTVDAAGSWVHFFVFVDKEGDGFTAGVAEDGYTPTGDLVAYSFYNNDAASDERGWNSVGQSITGDSRNKPSVPAFTAPAEAGTYRLRFKQDWCNIDPQGDADGKFGDFKHNGGQIIDLLLVVTNTTGISEVKGESGEVKGAYDLTGRKLEQITAPGVYIVNGKKVLVK